MKRTARVMVRGTISLQQARVEILSGGPRRARVRLLSKQLKVPQRGTPGRWLKKGDTFYVPSDCLAREA